MKFRKKPVVIEAVQYNNLNRDEINEFVGVQLKQELESETAYVAGQGPPKFSLIIPTLEGCLKAMPFDWIIKGVNGEFYPCKPDIFDKTYEAVNELDTPSVVMSKDFHNRITGHLRRMIATMDHLNQDTGMDAVDSPELADAKALLAELEGDNGD